MMMKFPRSNGCYSSEEAPVATLKYMQEIPLCMYILFLLKPHPLSQKISKTLASFSPTMALRLRQALKTLTPLLGHRTPISRVWAPLAVEGSGVLRLLPATNLQSRSFRSSPIWLSSSRSFNNQKEEIGPDTILFEGCDYNHWLITMDFPKDPKPTPEEMVETYVQTLAKGLNIRYFVRFHLISCSFLLLPFFDCFLVALFGCREYCGGRKGALS